MNTTEVSILLAKKLKITQSAARVLLREKLAALRESLISESSIELPGLGDIQVRKVKERRQYIPTKNDVCIVPAHKRPAFRIDNLFKARLRKQGPQ